MKKKVNGSGRASFGFSLKPKVVKDFSEICKDKGFIGSRKIEIMMLDFIKKEAIE